jgi:hypothetical protein
LLKAWKQIKGAMPLWEMAAAMGCLIWGKKRLVSEND